MVYLTLSRHIKCYDNSQEYYQAVTTDFFYVNGGNYLISTIALQALPTMDTSHRC